MLRQPCLKNVALTLGSYAITKLQTRWLKQQPFISHCSGGWEIQDQGPSRVSVWWGPASWFADSCLLAVSSHGAETELRSLPLIKVINPVLGTPCSWHHLILISSEKSPYLQLPWHWGWRFQPLNLGGTHLVYSTFIWFMYKGAPNFSACPQRISFFNPLVPSGFSVLFCFSQRMDMDMGDSLNNFYRTSDNLKEYTWISEQSRVIENRNKERMARLLSTSLRANGNTQ